MNQVPSIYRASGESQSERYLKQLCDASFLSLWSYLNIFRDQGQQDKKGDGKEVCDLLVVFQNHIIIFSDKSCNFPDTGNLQLDWSRWFRKSIWDPAEKIWGAEKWIKFYPCRLFLDRSCTQRFPLDLPDSKNAIFHRILVARNGSQRCQQELGGSGSFSICPAISGAQHMKSEQTDCRPFAVGQVSPAKGFIHIFDDTSLDITLKTLDTITDFVTYLTKKESFIQSGGLGGDPGEEDLLAYYLSNLNEQGEHDFVVSPQSKRIIIDKGCWEQFSQSPQRNRQIQANEISYSWDTLLEKFFNHIFDGTSYKLTHPSFQRRFLAERLRDLIFKAPISQQRVQVIPPVKKGEPYYVFLVFPHAPFIKSDEEYRERRAATLVNYCRVVKYKYPDATDILGIATETGTSSERSEDALRFDARIWSDNDQEDARKLHEELRLLKNITNSRGMVKEYPDSNTIPFKLLANVKGRDRNTLCFCGNGRKYKKCCGRKLP
jgi:SEC-C motif